MANLFKKAAAITPPAAPKSGSTKHEAPIDGLQDYAQVDALIKTLEALKATLETEVKATSFQQFMLLSSNGVRPASFRGVEGNASASVELRKRSTTSPLSTDEVILLQAHNVTVESKIIKQHLFAINPKYASDEKLLEKVSDAIAKIVPEDFIVEQVEEKKDVVGDVTITEAFRDDVPEEVIKAVTVLALKPKLDSFVLKDVMASVSKMLEAV